jgi:F0F1-type ATP synthase membrane subunit b/b'
MKPRRPSIKDSLQKAARNRRKAKQDKKNATRREDLNQSSARIVKEATKK